MIDAIEKMMMNLPSVKGKNPEVACIVGFVFGGLGLAIYFRHVVDLFFPVGVALVASVLLGGFGLLAGAIVAAIYGYYRVHLSEREAKAAAGGSPATGWGG